jgi:3,4-dihydroxy 2-butanone 4-phosphate synthase/GTP cyclohydrolase II
VIDTVDANLHLGLPVDGREYGTGAQILSALGIERVRLITHNPAKSEELVSHGIEVEERVALPIRRTPENVAYLETKRRRMGHLLGALETNTG